MAGRESSQKMKKETQSAVVVPESGLKVLGIFSRSWWTLADWGWWV
jgi:hypothetical protein